jgi:hypothetical protein
MGGLRARLPFSPLFSRLVYHVLGGIQPGREPFAIDSIQVGNQLTALT